MKVLSVGLRLSRPLVFFALVLCTSATGCALFHKPDAALVAGIDAGLNGSGLLDEYDRYVDADQALKDPKSKAIKHETAAKLRQLIKDAQAK